MDSMLNCLVVGRCWKYVVNYSFISFHVRNPIINRRKKHAMMIPNDKQIGWEIQNPVEIIVFVGRYGSILASDSFSLMEDEIMESMEITSAM